MKNKKGFISMSIVYSFFLVFTLLLILIMSTYVNNRLSFQTYKNDIKTRVPNGESIIESSASNLHEYCNIPGNSSLLSCWLYNNKGIYLKEGSVDGVHFAYRFVGSSPTNFACFGTNKDCYNAPGGTIEYNVASVMLNLENLQYRIVGIYDGYYLGKSSGNYYVKMVRNNQATSTSYNSFTSSTSLSYVSLNSYSSQIVSASWYQCINSGTKNRFLFWMYDSPKSCSSFTTGQISLLYASDFGYSSSTLGDYQLLTTNNTFTSSWLYKQPELLISPSSSSQTWAIDINSKISALSRTTSSSVRPALYLNYSMKYKNGSGLSTTDGITFGV